MKHTNPYKKIPNFWWDFDQRNTIIVESDHPKFPVVGRFKYDPRKNKDIGCASPAIEQAQKLIADLKAGRVTPHAC